MEVARLDVLGKPPRPVAPIIRAKPFGLLPIYRDVTQLCLHTHGRGVFFLIFQPSDQVCS